MITRMKPWIFTNSPYIWISKFFIEIDYFTKIRLNHKNNNFNNFLIIIFRKIAKIINRVDSSYHFCDFTQKWQFKLKNESFDNSRNSSKLRSLLLKTKYFSEKNKISFEEYAEQNRHNENDFQNVIHEILSIQDQGSTHRLVRASVGASWCDIYGFYRTVLVLVGGSLFKTRYLRIK